MPSDTVVVICTYGVHVQPVRQEAPDQPEAARAPVTADELGA